MCQLSFINNKNKIGPRWLPCGTPDVTVIGDESSSKEHIESFRLGMSTAIWKIKEQTQFFQV